jgi:branched-chain amino acid transport system permease protein
MQQQWFGTVYVEPSDLRMLLFGLALVAMMLFRPAGLWPSSIRRRELSADDAVEAERAHA